MNFKKSVAVPQPAGICKEKCWLSAWSWKWGFVPCLLAVGSWKMYLESLSLPCIQSGEAGLIFFSTFCCLFFFFLTRVFLRVFCCCCCVVFFSLSPFKSHLTPYQSDQPTPAQKSLSSFEKGAFHQVPGGPTLCRLSMVKKSKNTSVAPALELHIDLLGVSVPFNTHSWYWKDRGKNYLCA